MCCRAECFTSVCVANNYSVNSYSTTAALGLVFETGPNAVDIIPKKRIVLNSHHHREISALVGWHTGILRKVGCDCCEGRGAIIGIAAQSICSHRSIQRHYGTRHIIIRLYHHDLHAVFVASTTLFVIENQQTHVTGAGTARHAHVPSQ